MPISSPLVETNQWANFNGLSKLAKKLGNLKCEIDIGHWTSLTLDIFSGS